jgi:hypothetical protein
LNKIHYVVAAYFGPRGHLDPTYNSDPACYLREHLASLERLPHRLSQITIVVAGDSGPLAAVNVPRKIQDANVDVMLRENVGFSYGSFSEAFDRRDRYEQEFSHFIFNEDDYIFTHDNFDDLLLDELESRTGCGMLCGAAWQHVVGDTRNVAAISVSIASTQVLEQATAKRNGHLPYRREPGYFPAYDSQIDFGFCIQDAGYSVQDWLSKWASAYRMGHGIDVRIRWFSRPGTTHTNVYLCPADTSMRAFVVPVQCLGKEVVVDDGRMSLVSRIQREGTVKALWPHHRSGSK